MLLHEDKIVFEEILSAASESLGQTLDIIEKDYYVTMILKLLSQQYDNVVFKGGTSLSKAFHVLSRFSEDIDITFSEHIGAPRRKKLKNVVIAGISKTLNMPILNWDKLQSDRDLNSYVFDYQPISPLSGQLAAGVKLETALGSYAFPTVEKTIDSYVFQYLVNTEREETIEKYNLQPFTMQVQAIERTFIDKVFALCDYYLEGKSTRLSRHLYDLYKLYPQIVFNQELLDLVTQVREHRSKMNICPSAKPEIDIKQTIHDICASDYFKADYESITTYFISDFVPYEAAKQCYVDIANNLFTYTVKEASCN